MKENDELINQVTTVQMVESNISPPQEVTSLDHKIQQVAQQVLECQDVDESKKLVDLFNWNISKKNVARVQKLSSLFDKITDQMEVRLTKKADEFSNNDLLQYMNAIQTATEKSQTALTGVSTIPAIQVQNNTQVNVNVVETFNRESRQRIADAIKQLLAGVNSQEQSEDLGDTENPIETEIYEQEEQNDK